MLTYCAYRKQRRKGVKQETLEVDANYFTTELIEEKNGIRIVVREELAESVLVVKRVSDRLMACEGKKVHPKYSKRVSLTG